MKNLSSDIKGAVTGFIILLCKGLLDDERWDWDVENSNWHKYQEHFKDPTFLKTTICIFLNNLKIDKGQNVINYVDARFRAFQYFRECIDSNYKMEHELEAWEFEEPDWYEWEG